MEFRHLPKDSNTVRLPNAIASLARRSQFCRALPQATIIP